MRKRNYIIALLIFSTLIFSTQQNSINIVTHASESVEYKGCYTFGDENYNDVNYSPGDNPFTYQAGSGYTRIISSFGNHLNVIESKMSSDNGYMEEIEIEDSPTNGSHSVEFWWAFEYMTMYTWVPSPTMWIYTQIEEHSSATAALYLGFGQGPELQDQWCISLWSINPTSVRLYKTDIDNNQGIDVDSNTHANKFYYFQFTFDYDANTIRWGFNGDLGWKYETINLDSLGIDLADDIGSVTKFALGSGFSSYKKHWLDSLSWTWNSEYSLGDLLESVTEGPPEEEPNIWDYWYYFVIGLVAIGATIPITVVLTKRKVLGRTSIPKPIPKNIPNDQNIQVFYCPKCGATLPILPSIEVEFCPYCGTGLSGRLH